jgi:mannose-6-phosphate isomerase
MHLEEALDCINYKKYDEAGCSCHLETDPAVAVAKGEGVRVLVEDPHFVITSLSLTAPAKVPMESFKSCVVLICLTGSVTVQAGDGTSSVLSARETLLLPASLDTMTLTPAAGGVHLLQVHLPQPPKDDVYEGPEPDEN